MEAINLEHGFLYYYGNRAGYQKGELVYVDSIFLTSHLKEAVEARYGKSVKEQEGLYERLLACQVLDRDGKCRVQFCRIWQWREEVAPEKKFLSYQSYTARFGAPRLEDYQVVYDGYSETDQLEAIFQKLNTRLPEGFPGHPLSLSDIIELYDEKNGSSFFYVDELGFQKLGEGSV